jgi:hypothetical protein
MEGSSRFRKALTAEKERLLVASILFRRIQDIIQNAVKVFEDWQSCREDKTARNVPSSSANLDI